MKKLLIGFLALSAAQAAWAVPVTFDLQKSTLQSTGKKVTGSHNGEVKLKSAEGDYSDTKLTGTFVIDMKSITVTDIESTTDNQKLVGHLKSADFFAANEHPAVTFTITGSKHLQNPAPNAPNVEITGDLTVKGIKHPITFPAVVEIQEGKVLAKGSATIDRTKFDVRYGSGKFFQGLGDKLIYDEFTVDINLVGNLVS